jgi:hypothetical protein
MLLGLGGCVAGFVLGALGEAKFGLLRQFSAFDEPPAAKVKVATYRAQEISNEVLGRIDLLALPVEMRRQLAELEAAEVAMRDRALGLKTMEELEAAKKEYFLMQEKRQLAQNFILQQRANINSRRILLDFIAGKFGAEFPVILESEDFHQLKSNFTGAFGAGVEVTDLTGPVIGALQEEIDGKIPPEDR